MPTDIEFAGYDIIIIADHNIIKYGIIGADELTAVSYERNLRVYKLIIN